jgi:hypothetical protein
MPLDAEMKYLLRQIQSDVIRYHLEKPRRYFLSFELIINFFL